MLINNKKDFFFLWNRIIFHYFTIFSSIFVISIKIENKKKRLSKYFIGVAISSKFQYSNVIFKHYNEKRNSLKLHIFFYCDV